MENDDNESIDIGDMCAALEGALQASDPGMREQLAKTIDAYRENFPNDFYWAMGAQSPMLLYYLFTSIDGACRPENQSKPRSVIRLVDRKP
jgi:hypothetical protein